MTELKTKLLDMFKWFHDFCIEKQITYYALGGTLLGAVRHKGFIPWDDDIDVGLPRNDYNRLIKEMKNVQGKYILETPEQCGDGFVYSYCKLYDTETTLIENTRYRTKRGIFLDIFPLDGIGNTEEESLQNFRVIEQKQNLINTKICALRKERKLYKNIAILLGRCIPSWIFDWRHEVKVVNELCASRAFDEYKFCGNLMGNWHEKEIARHEWFGTPILLNFEDAQILAPCNYDKYLTQVYGDYMTPPPIEKQKTHHDYLALDLNTSYL